MTHNDKTILVNRQGKWQTYALLYVSFKYALSSNDSSLTQGSVSDQALCPTLWATICSKLTLRPGTSTMTNTAPSRKESFPSPSTLTGQSQEIRTSRRTLTLQDEWCRYCQIYSTTKNNKLLMPWFKFTSKIF